MRLFIALNFPDDVRLALFEAAAPLRASAPGARWTSAEKLHLTIKFLGARAPALVEALAGALDAVGLRHAPIELRIGGIGAFPNAWRARIVWIGIEATAPLVALQHDLDDACGAIGIAREDRPFHPHVTLARIGPRVPRRDVQALMRDPEVSGVQANVVARTVDLVQSVDGRYATLHRATLAG